MKGILLTIIIISTYIISNAQTKAYGKYDYEISLSIPTSANDIYGYTNSDYAPYIGFECRRQLNKLPIDVGLHMAISAVVRTENNSSYINYFRAVPILAVSDYQFERGKKVNPYVGLGAGVSFNTIVEYIGRNDINFTLAPRIGIRFYKFLNASVCYYATHKDYSRLNFNLGVYF